MIKLKIDVKKIDKSKLFVGAKGTYLDCVLVDRPDDFGSDGFVSQDVTKAERDAGQKGVIIGNWKHLGQKPAPAPKQWPPARQAARPAVPLDPDLDAPEEDDIPF